MERPPVVHIRTKWSGPVYRASSSGYVYHRQELESGGDEAVCGAPVTSYDVDRPSAAGMVKRCDAAQWGLCVECAIEAGLV